VEALGGIPVVVLPKHLLSARACLALVLAAGAALRFYGLGWGAPYYHFHIDEHVVFSGADMIARSPREAALSPKFFMYSPLPMYILIVVRWIWQAATATRLDLGVPHDEIVFTLLGRAISATIGTATIVVVYAVARRVGDWRSGLLAAGLTAFGVLHLRESHFFTTDIPMTFFSVVTLWMLLPIVDEGITWRRDLAVSLAFGAALLCKYTAVFLVPVIGLAYLLAGPLVDTRPVALLKRALHACIPGVLGLVFFLAGDPLVIEYYGKFRQDIADWVTAPLTGTWKPIWTAQFADVTSPHLYWFTNILWWGLGPAFEIVGLAGVVWLFWRRDRRAAVAGAFVVAYFIVAGRTVTPFARYGVPLVPALAITAGVFLADLLDRPRWRKAAVVLTLVTLTTTGAYAAAYLHVFAAPDSRLAASNYMIHHVPAGARVLVEPSQNMVPFGSYLEHPDFNRDYMFRHPEEARNDYYHLVSLDTYVFLYDRNRSQEAKRAYITSRIAQADYIVMDDTFLQFYQHLPQEPHAAVKQYYDDLFAGRLGFELMKTYKVYPSLFGVSINDDRAELTFRLFDHPRIFIFRRTSVRG
jgi:4-amino-4-deoxy-L-arabinose transferase-like glycosyltransferase